MHLFLKSYLLVLIFWWSPSLWAQFAKPSLNSCMAGNVASCRKSCLEDVHDCQRLYVALKKQGNEKLAIDHLKQLCAEKNALACNYVEKILVANHSEAETWPPKLEKIREHNAFVHQVRFESKDKEIAYDFKTSPPDINMLLSDMSSGSAMGKKIVFPVEKCWPFKPVFGGFDYVVKMNCQWKHRQPELHIVAERLVLSEMLKGNNAKHEIWYTGTIIAARSEGQKRFLHIVVDVESSIETDPVCLIDFESKAEKYLNKLVQEVCGNRKNSSCFAYPSNTCLKIKLWQEQFAEDLKIPYSCSFPNSDGMSCSADFKLKTNCICYPNNQDSLPIYRFNCTNKPGSAVSCSAIKNK